MAKKVTISLLALLLVAGTIVGLYFYNSDKMNKDDATPESAVVSEQYLDEDDSAEEYFVDSTEAQTTDTQEATEISDDFFPSDDSLLDNTSDMSTTNFTIERIVDHTTNEQVQGRVVFGSGFTQDGNYIKFDQSGNFEIYLSGYLDEVTKGTYTEYDNLIYVEFEDGTAAEYEVQYTENGIISYIIVNYGDYDIYFS